MRVLWHMKYCSCWLPLCERTDHSHSHSLSLPFSLSFSFSRVKPLCIASIYAPFCTRNRWCIIASMCWKVRIFVTFKRRFCIFKYFQVKFFFHFFFLSFYRNVVQVKCKYFTGVKFSSFTGNSTVQNGITDKINNPVENFTTIETRERKRKHKRKIWLNSVFTVPENF